MGEVTTIPLHQSTRDRLKMFGLKGATYDDILTKLMDETEYNEFMERQYSKLKDKSLFVPLEDAA